MTPTGEETAAFAKRVEADIEEKLLDVLKQYVRLDTIPGQRVAARVFVDLAGQAMVAQQLLDAERAPRWCRELLDQFELFVLPSGTPPQ